MASKSRLWPKFNNRCANFSNDQLELAPYSFAFRHGQIRRTASGHQAPDIRTSTPRPVLARRSRTFRAIGCFHHDDLYACSQSRWTRCSESTGSSRHAARRPPANANILELNVLVPLRGLMCSASCYIFFDLILLNSCVSHFRRAE